MKKAFLHHHLYPALLLSLGFFCTLFFSVSLASETTVSIGLTILPFPDTGAIDTGIIDTGVIDTGIIDTGIIDTPTNNYYGSIIDEKIETGTIQTGFDSLTGIDIGTGLLTGIIDVSSGQNIIDLELNTPKPIDNDDIKHIDFDTLICEDSVHSVADLPSIIPICENPIHLAADLETKIPKSIMNTYSPIMYSANGFIYRGESIYHPFVDYLRLTIRIDLPMSYQSIIFNRYHSIPLVAINYTPTCYQSFSDYLRFGVGFETYKPFVSNALICDKIFSYGI